MCLPSRVVFPVVFLALAGCGEQDLIGGQVGQNELAVVSTNGQTLNGDANNGRSWNGRSWNGRSWNGRSWNGRSWNGLSLNGSNLQATDEGGGILGGADLVGSELTGPLLDGTSVTARIDVVEPKASDPDILLYTVSIDNAGVWEPLCGLDSGGSPVKAIPLSGYWDYSEDHPAGRDGPDDLGGGAHYDDPNYITFACQGYALAKCTEMGYKPWETRTEYVQLVVDPDFTDVLTSVPGGYWSETNGLYSFDPDAPVPFNSSKPAFYNDNIQRWYIPFPVWEGFREQYRYEVPLAAHHQACTRMLRADYCGDGTPHTQNGTQIDVWDAVGVQSSAAEATNWTFDAAWGVGGATCVSETRWGTIDDGTGSSSVGDYITDPAHCPGLQRSLPETCMAQKGFTFASAATLGSCLASPIANSPCSEMPLTQRPLLMDRSERLNEAVLSASIGMAASGINFKNLDLEATTVNGLGVAVQGATVAVDIFRDEAFVETLQGTTLPDGRVTVTVPTPPTGRYTAIVSEALAEHRTWDREESSASVVIVQPVTSSADVSPGVFANTNLCMTGMSYDGPVWSSCSIGGPPIGRHYAGSTAKWTGHCTDNLGAGLLSATVSTSLYRDGVLVRSNTSACSNGSWSYTEDNPVSGSYRLVVAGVTVNGLPWDGVSAESTVVVQAGTARATITYSYSAGLLTLTIAIQSPDGYSVVGASVAFSIYRDGVRIASSSGETKMTSRLLGGLTYQTTNPLPGTYTTQITSLSAPGLTWDGTTPQNSYVLAATISRVSAVSYVYNSRAKALEITLSLANEFAQPLANASVAFDVLRGGTRLSSQTGTTGANGTYRYSLANPSRGTYSVAVTGVTATGLTWDRVTPTNSYVR